MSASRLIAGIACAVWAACGRVGFAPVGATDAMGDPTGDAANVPLCRTVVVTTLAGNGGAGFADGTGGVGGTAQFDTPTGVAADSAGNVYVADYNNHRIRKIDPDGTTTTLAGDGVAGFVDGTASTTRFSYPHDLAVDGSGTVYVSDRGNHCIRKVAPNGTTTTLAGNGTAGFRDGSGGATGTTMFRFPNDVAVDTAGNVYVADFDNHRIRKIDQSGATITLAGNGTSGFADGTGGATGTTMFDRPAGIAVAAGVVYVSDGGNGRIRKIAPSGTTTTLAGNGNMGLVDGPGATAELAGPAGMAIDGADNLYVAEYGNNSIREITADGTTTTVAGNGSGTFVDGIGCDARFVQPQSVAMSASNVLVVADRSNNRIRTIALP